MNNDRLKYVIGQAISNITSKNKSEYAELNEIYNEVSNIINKKNSYKLQAQIRARLQECCLQYDAYLGKDNFFQTKKKHSGLWKNKITTESELTPYINNIIKQYPGIDTTMLKSKLYELVNLTPGDKAISLTRHGEMKIDQIMRNFVSHKNSHKNIRFDNNKTPYKMYYIGEDSENIDIDLYTNAIQDDTVYDIISEELEVPIDVNENKVKLKFINDKLVPKNGKHDKGQIFIRKNDINTWITKEKSRVKNGNLAEGLVFVAEKLKLQEMNREDLAQKVKWISRDSGDGFGYDILSYDIDKSGSAYEIHIEVKSTVNLNDDFIMSSNELKYARENRDTYRLYRVARVNSDNPVCKVIKVDFDELFDFEPSQYKVTVKK